MGAEFTPWSALIGGGLIGVATLMLMGLQGRILGATGILFGFFTPLSSSDWAWRAWVLLGMVSAPLAYLLITGGWADYEAPVSRSAMVVGGLLVGAGVANSSGCTSGHGVCGLARGARRSVVATLLFMAATFATVFVLRHGFGGAL